MRLFTFQNQQNPRPLLTKNSRPEASNFAKNTHAESVTCLTTHQPNAQAERDYDLPGTILVTIAAIT